MAFETFQKQRAPLTNEPAVTIQKRGNFSLNAKAFADLGEPKAVELLYDRAEQLIGISPAQPGADNAYVIRPMSTSGSSYLVSGIAFAAYYGIDTTIAKRWIAEVSDGMLIVDLKKPGTVVTSNRFKNAPNTSERSPIYVARSAHQDPGRSNPSASPVTSRGGDAGS